MNARISCVVASAAACLFFCASLSAAQPQAHDYLSRLDNPRPSELPDGRVIISLDAYAGDLPGLLTLTLTQDGDTYKGSWAFSATYLEDLRADGTPIAREDHFAHDHDDPGTPATHREYARMRRDGALVGTVDAATLYRTDQGLVATITSATLTITGGSRAFKDATGSGRLGSWPALPRELTLFFAVVTK